VTSLSRAHVSCGEETQSALTLRLHDSSGVMTLISVTCQGWGRRLAPREHLDEASRSGLRKVRSDSLAVSIFSQGHAPLSCG
jgi:hypothetical protein